MITISALQIYSGELGRTSDLLWPACIY